MCIRDSIKLGAGLATNSLGILSEALHSSLDLVAAGITFFAVRGYKVKAAVQGFGKDTDVYKRQAVSNSLSLTGQELRAQASEKGITVLRSRLTPDNRLEFLLPRAEQRTELQELLSKDFSQLAVDSPTQVEGGGLRFTAVFTPAAKAKIEEMALDQAVRTIRNRIRCV